MSQNPIDDESIDIREVLARPDAPESLALKEALRSLADGEIIAGNGNN